jgi:maltooligosyltrehalose trehalohydrolase
LGQPRGASPEHIPPPRFIHCIQNHDQVGNRAFGERLNHNVPLDAYRAASALLLLSPYTPLLWMGQEWAASTPFLYFTDHNAELGRLVTEGRRIEFASFTAFSNKQVPDPQARETFLRSKLRWEERERPSHAEVLRLYRDLIGLRRRLAALRRRARGMFTVTLASEYALALRQRGSEQKDTLLLIVNLHGRLRLDLGDLYDTNPPPECTWTQLLDTEDAKYGGRGDTHLVEGTTLEMSGPGALLVTATAQPRT